MVQPTKRSVLESLKKTRLVEIAEAFELDLPQSRTRAEFVEAIASSHRASFERVLEVLGRDELKALCREHGLDDGGREKRVLVDRLLGRESSVAAEASPGYDVLLRPPEEATPKRRKTAGTGAGGKRSKKAGAVASDGDESRWASSTKIRLSRFAVDAAAGYRDADGDIRCARDLIRCFGWGPDEALPAEIPAVCTVVAQGTRTERRIAAVLRERRAVLEVIERERSITDGWTNLLPVVLQLEPVPQYVVVTNQRDVALFDLRKDRIAPRLSRAVDELPKYSEAFPFFARDWSPGATPQIINVDKVSKEVAELVAKVYRSFKADHPQRGGEVIRFTLQCILAMFAEDIGLLPQAHFTSLLYQAAERGDAEQRLGELFRLMSTPGDGDRAIKYFNGGLFSTPVSLPVSRDQLTALTKAAEANWTHVDPHIFGSVFQGIMDDAERHASGAHYTEKEDIMRVVGPTIVEPWRKRINAATGLGELRALRSELLKFRVLDPACGSGNFLYVSFRELYRLENELIARMHEFASVANDPKLRGAWGSGIPTTNFYGIDINPFAVELARATLNIAKKIAFDDRRAFVADRFGQVELELDPSLPLDNLEGNIVCADALFTEWPEVEAIVGNPPFLGDKKLRSELGSEYVRRLQEMHESANVGLVDLCCYWFRRAHDRLPPLGRAGLVGTSSIRVGKAREASLDYIVSNGGTLTSAVSSRVWPGEAALHVSMVNWTKGAVEGPFSLVVGNRTFSVPRIPSHLQLHSDISTARSLIANRNGTTVGVHFGSEAFLSTSESFPLDRLRGKPFLRPVASATPMLTGELGHATKCCILLPDCASETAAAKFAGEAFEHLERYVRPHVVAVSASYHGWLGRWWEPWAVRPEFWAAIARKLRYVACSNPQARPIYALLSANFVPTNTLQVFAFDDDYSFGIIQSTLHWKWTKAMGGKVTERIRYTTDVWRTFPWPQHPPTDLVAEVGTTAQALRETRRTLMQANNYSLRALYQAAEVPGPHPLKDAQARLDAAVAAAYGLPADQEPLEFLLELNLALAEDEAQGRPIQGPGLPAGLDPNDPRWMSTDCIEPPPLEPHADGQRRTRDA